MTKIFKILALLLGLGLLLIQIKFGLGHGYIGLYFLAGINEDLLILRILIDVYLWILGLSDY